MHVLKYFLAYGFALAFSEITMGAQPDRRQLVDAAHGMLTQSLVYLALAIWAACWPRRRACGRPRSGPERFGGLERRV